jgi:hypothetical protein
MQHEPAFMRPQEDCVLTVVHGELGDGHELALLEGLSQKGIRPATRFLGKHVVGRFKENWIYLTGLDEFQDFHSLGGLGFDLLDLIRLDDDVFILAILITLHDFAAFYDFSVRQADILLLEARKIIAMQHVEGNPGTTRAGEKSDRHGNQAEGKISRPNRSRHVHPVVGMARSMRQGSEFRLQPGI